MRRQVAFCVLFLAILSLPLASQITNTSQTLPPAHETTEGNFNTDQPFFSGAFTPHQRWQWVYDSSLFDAPGLITITEVFIRPNANQALGQYNFPSVEVVMATAPGNYDSLQLNDMNANLNSDAVVVRQPSQWYGPPSPSNQTGPTANFIPLGLTTPFQYDPTLGADLVIQVRSCGWTHPWDQRIDAAATLGSFNFPAHRYGNTFDCIGNVVDLHNHNVPVVQIDYQFVNASSVVQGTGVGPWPIAPTLLATAVVPGAPVLIAGHFAPILAPGALVVSRVPTAPFSPPSYPGLFYIDVGFYTVASPLMSDPLGTWLVTAQVPPGNWMIGQQIMMQSFFTDLSSPESFASTNGLLVTIGAVP